MIKRIEVEKRKDSSKSYCETLIQTANIADPVQNAVDIPIDAVEGQVELPLYLHLYAVRVFVAATLHEGVAENLMLILC